VEVVFHLILFVQREVIIMYLYYLLL